MKDLALPDHLPALRAAGVSCFKIEGRKKSPLYVATTTDYYRKLLDGQLTAAERPEHEADMQTVFSRPWTHLFVQSHKDKEVADRDTVGHRGTPVGEVEAVHDRAKPGLFRTRRLVSVELVLTGEELVAVGRVLPQGPVNDALEVSCTLTGPFEKAKDPVAMAAAARSTFEKLGQTGLTLASFA